MQFYSYSIYTYYSSSQQWSFLASEVEATVLGASEMRLDSTMISPDVESAAVITPDQKIDHFTQQGLFFDIAPASSNVFSFNPSVIFSHPLSMLLKQLKILA